VGCRSESEDFDSKLWLWGVGRKKNYKKKTIRIVESTKHAIGQRYRKIPQDGIVITNCSTKVACIEFEIPLLQ
jgi:hypothetical protein